MHSGVGVERSTSHSDVELVEDSHVGVGVGHEGVGVLHVSGGGVGVGVGGGGVK